MSTSRNLIQVSSRIYRSHSKRFKNHLLAVANSDNRAVNQATTHRAGRARVPPRDPEQ